MYVPWPIVEIELKVIDPVDEDTEIEKDASLKLFYAYVKTGLGDAILVAVNGVIAKV